jgi:aspartyl-tRNA(Asn)/glutamyl-tRNA(Gln) amidotransferase subunit C
MKVSEKEVAYIAGLANLELTEDERRHMVCDLTAILDYMGMLNGVGTTSAAPMAQVASGQNWNATTREDELEGLRRSLTHDVAMANAPETDATFFLVPKVIER